MHDIDTLLDQQNKPPLVFEDALKRMLQSTAGRLGEDFIHRLVVELCQTLHLDVAIIARFHEKDRSKLQTIAVYADGQPQDNFQFGLQGSFCQQVIDDKKSIIESAAQKAFARDLMMLEFNIESGMGVVLKDSANHAIGVLLGLSHCPLHDKQLVNSIFDVFAFRVSSELERQAINQNLRNEVIINQTQIDSVPALMFMLDRHGRFIRWNHYFRSKFGYTRQQIENQSMLMTVQETDRKRIELELEEVFAKGRGSVYVNGVTNSGEVVPLLATAESTTYQGEPVIVGVALDMSEQQVVERNLLRSQGRLATVSNILPSRSSACCIPSRRIPASHFQWSIATSRRSKLSPVAASALPCWPGANAYP